VRHLLVIGRPLPVIANADTEKIAKKVTSSRVIVRRCEDPTTLPQIVADVGKDGLIDVLDLFDHANAGVQSMGGKVLFQSDAKPQSPVVGADIAFALRPYLADHAQVRLLGCKSALGPEGRLLLFKLRLIFGQHRVVIGTIDGDDVNDFDENGFRLESEKTYFFDSYAAFDNEAPDKATRIKNYLALLG
jgi:hypothetical protein